ncbi:putative solid-state culture-specific atp-grasp domain protein [Rhypophila sp. PSN 637]
MAAPKLPTVTLDQTLVDLYRQAIPRQAGHAHSRLGIVLGFFSSSIDLTPDIPRNTKYLYQDSHFVEESLDQLTIHNHQLKYLSVLYLCIKPQSHAFISGQTPTIFFHRGQTLSEQKHDRSQVEETLSVLDPSQRPQLIFCSGPSNIPLAEHGIQGVIYNNVSDEMASQYKDSLIHDPDLHWYLSSQTALGLSRLPRPTSSCIHVIGYPPTPGHCCPKCLSSDRDSRNKSQIPHIPKNCTGQRKVWLSAQQKTILDRIEAQALPFILWTSQPFEAPPREITTDEEKSALLSDLRGENSLLEKLLSQLTKKNEHLDPADLLITGFVNKPDKPGKVYNVTFMVTEGGPVYLAAAEQIRDFSGVWEADIVDYSHQDYLKDKFQLTIEQTAEWIKKASVSAGRPDSAYFGPVGIDIVVVESYANNGNNGNKFDINIINLNVGPSGPLPLALLRTHFTSRGLDFATIATIRFRGNRALLLHFWKAEFESGRMIILSF